MQDKARLRAAGDQPALEEALLSAEEAAAILRRAEAIVPPNVGKEERDSDDDEDSPFSLGAANEVTSRAQPVPLSPDEANAILARAQAIAPPGEKNWKSSWTFGLLG
jgi:hypothetical protein